ncbi:MAG: helix-turn-helix transcriptional regulator [Bacillota bacterium]|nr:helix-turn-helix transcriptional regulator [Bacillota bacterium]
MVGVYIDKDEVVSLLIYGGKIRLLREQRGYNLSQFAKMSGISPSYLSEIERESKQPSLKTVAKLAETLNVTKDQLIKSENLDTLGKKLRQVREEQGLTQHQLAELAGLSAGLIGQVEHEKVQPSLKTVEKLALVLGISPCYFVLDNYDGENLMPILSNDLRELLQESQVQAVLRLICNLKSNELKFILNFIQLYKKSKLDT